MVSRTTHNTRPTAAAPGGLVVHFPPPAAWRRAGRRNPVLRLLADLGLCCPPRWRRQVIIQGRRFWLPG
jgi:hypothetical protein